MRVTVVQLGRLRDPHVEALRDEYVKRFRAFGSLAVVERRPDRFAWPDGGGYRVALDERGRTLDSRAFATALAAWCRERGDVTFVIGGADGLPPDVRATADQLLSLGPMVLPHRLAHLVLVEQLYRAGAILAGHPYHRD